MQRFLSDNISAATTFPQQVFPQCRMLSDTSASAPRAFPQGAFPLACFRLSHPRCCPVALASRPALWHPSTLLPASVVTATAIRPRCLFPASPRSPWWSWGAFHCRRAFLRLFQVLPSLWLFCNTQQAS
jgi:hypothetical protein